MGHNKLHFKSRKSIWLCNISIFFGLNFTLISDYHKCVTSHLVFCIFYWFGDISHFFRAERAPQQQSLWITSFNCSAWTVQIEGRKTPFSLKCTRTKPSSKVAFSKVWTDCDSCLFFSISFVTIQDWLTELHCYVLDQLKYVCHINCYLYHRIYRQVSILHMYAPLNTSKLQQRNAVTPQTQAEMLRPAVCVSIK
jgi:hypothetical protein